MIKNIKYLLLPFLLVFFVLPNITSAQTASSPECQSQVGPLPPYCNTTNKTVTTSVSKTICDGYMSSDNTVCITPQMQSDCSSIGGRIDIKTGDCVSANQNTQSAPAWASSYVFLKHNLMIGLSKDSNTDGEVTTLQSFLKSVGVFNASPTGYFGKETASAVKNFQGKKYDNVSADDIDSTLVPSLSNRQWLAKTGFFLSKTGYVGAFTRAKIKYVSYHNPSTSNTLSAQTSNNTQSTSVETSNSTVTTSQLSSNTAYSSDDLCVSQGLHNIDETNFSIAKNVVRSRAYDSFIHTYWQQDKAFAYKMNSGESYSFPISNYDERSAGKITEGNPYVSSPPYVAKISEKKCDFSYEPKDYKLPTGATVGGVKKYNSIKDYDPCVAVNRGNTDARIIYTQSITGRDLAYPTCRLDPAKKYYLNVRWLNKSDVFDSAGNLLTASTSPLGKLISRINAYNGLNPESLKFNSVNGDSCLNVNDPMLPCVITNHTSGYGNTYMPLITPERQKLVTTIDIACHKETSDNNATIKAYQDAKTARGDTSPLIGDPNVPDLKNGACNIPTETGVASNVSPSEVGPYVTSNSTKNPSKTASTKIYIPAGSSPSSFGTVGTKLVDINTSTYEVKTGTNATVGLRYMGPRTMFCVDPNTTTCTPSEQLGTGQSSGFTYGTADGDFISWVRTKVLGVGVPAGTTFHWNFKDPDTGLSTKLNIKIVN